MEVGKPLEKAIVLSKLMYWNVVCAHMPKYVINRLQQIQYATAEYAINPHWLPIKGHTEISTINLVHRSLRRELCFRGCINKGARGAMPPPPFFAKPKKNK